MTKSKYQSQVKRGKLGCIIIPTIVIGAIVSFYIIIGIMVGHGVSEAAKNIATVLREKKDENFKFLEGTYEYVYEHNTNINENHYIKLKNDTGTYFGTSDDFDDAREGYYVGFFRAKMDSLKISRTNISFSLYVNDSIFFDKPVTPFSVKNNKSNWTNSIQYNWRKYEGKINGDTIEIVTDGFDKRKFIKINSD
ncbi:hypothetical protein [Tenacibaculum sp. 190524A05c]|uniref:hypothetical protein n=1 Tax=Tenacibaculum platacis TaxID=3137852 RepID=UPI0031FA524A